MGDLGSLSSSASLPGLGGLSGTLQGGVNSLTTKSQNLLDRFLPPETRETIKEKLMAFATEKPMLASFLLSQIALSGLPIALFLIMSLTVVIFALLAGILVGVLGAVLFIVFALGFALIVLLPTLFFTTFMAVAVWLWGMGAYYIVKWFNEKKFPGIHQPLGEGFSSLRSLNGLGKAQDDNAHIGDEKNGTTDSTNGNEKIENKGSGAAVGANGAQSKIEHHGDGKENQEASHGQNQGVTKSPQHRKKVKDSDRTSNKNPARGLGDVKDNVKDIGNNVTGVL